MKIWSSFKIEFGSGGSEILKIFAISVATAVSFSKKSARRRLSRSAYTSNFELSKIWVYHWIELIELKLEPSWDSFLNEYGKVLFEYGANFTYVTNK